MNFDNIYTYNNHWFIFKKVPSGYKRLWHGGDNGIVLTKGGWLRDSEIQEYVDTGIHKDDIEIFKLIKEL